MIEKNSTFQSFFNVFSGIIKNKNSNFESSQGNFTLKIDLKTLQGVVSISTKHM
jgi:hypothetical protein